MTNPADTELLQQALEYQKTGNLESAGQIYQELLEKDPENADASNLLGALYCQVGQLDRAAGLIRKAVALHPERYAYHVNLGVVHEKSGNLPAAEQSYRKALDLSPDEPMIMYNLANCLQAANRLEEAVDVYKRVIALAPGHSNARLNMAICSIKAGNYGAAEEILEKAVEQEPDNEYLLLNLAICKQKKGDPLKANELLERVLGINPENEAAIIELGNTYFSRGRYMEAARHFRRVSEKNPGNLLAAVNLGNCLMKQGELFQAEEIFREVLEKDPNFILAIYNLGVILFQKGDFRQAEKILRQAVEENPVEKKMKTMLAKILVILGSTLQAQGRGDEALALYQEALPLNEDFFEAYLNISELLEKSSKLEDSWEYVKKLMEAAPDNPEVNTIAAVILRRKGKIQEALDTLVRIEIPTDDPNKASKIHFELGRLHDKAGNYDRAFEHFQEANACRMSYLEYQGVDKNRFLSRLEGITQISSPANLAAIRGETGPPVDDTPVFLVGFPRSGTTLTDQILDNHPLLHVMEEEPVLEGAIHAADSLLPESERYPESLLFYQEEHLETFREKYFQLADRVARRAQDTMLVDKMPLRIIDLGYIRKVFPRARIIVVIRHPFDVCLSNFMQNYHLNDAMANFMTLEDAAIVYDKVMNLWLRYQENLQLDYHVLRYEDLVVDFDREHRRLLDFLGLQLPENAQTFYEHARGRERIKTPSYEQVVQPIYDSSRYRWKSYAPYFEPVRPLLEKYVEHFGYEK